MTAVAMDKTFGHMWSTGGVGTVASQTKKNNNNLCSCDTSSSYDTAYFKIQTQYIFI